ncbi:coenzyme F420-0:L-glutamate ligase [Streptomyces thermoviolaceus]|uniref:coenzyme F420-0:L-glutamate ligase n=1 Tax=Streptomyces thermoviolaceus TaxID=1952 RepID=UPI00339E6BDC
MTTHTGADVAVVTADSDGRADRRGATVISIGAAGIAPLRITEHGGKRQEETFTDLIAAAAGIILGQRGRGAPVAALRGIAHSARAGESQQCSTTGHDTAGHRVADTIGIRLAVCLTCEGITLRLLNGGRYRAAGARTSRHPTHGKETMSLQVTEAASAEPAEAVRRVI